MKTLVNLASHVLLFICVPIIVFLYLFILVLFTLAELMFYIFDRSERKRSQLIKKLLFPLHKR